MLPATGAGRHRAESLAVDVGVAIAQLAPDAAAVVGMSLGGLTAIALAERRPGPRPPPRARRHHAGRGPREGEGDHRLRPRPGDVRQLRRDPRQDDRAQPDAHRGVAAPRHPAQRRAARRRVVALALPPRRRLRPDEFASDDDIDATGAAVGRPRPGQRSGDAGPRHAPAIGRRRRRRGRAAAGASRTSASSTSPRPGTACRATCRSSWPRAIASFVDEG